MNILEAVQTTVTQAEFAEVIGVSPAAVSAMFSSQHLERGATCHAWILAYCKRLREQAAGRLGADPDGLDLVQERARLAREQRIGYEVKNAVARGEYAPTVLLAEVLAVASQSVAERLEHLPVTLKKQCPELTPPQLSLITAHICAARNEWVKSTAELVVARVFPDDDDPQLDGPDELLDPGAGPDGGARA